MTIADTKAVPANARWVQVTVRGDHRSPAQQAAHDAETAAYQLAIEALRDSRYIDYPSMVGIETMAVCNASCDFCAYPSMPRKGDRMTDALLARILDEIDEFPKDLKFAVCFSRYNEPFLDKRLFGFVEDLNARVPLAHIWMYSNASPIDQRAAQRLRDWRNVEHFGISFNDHRPDDYERTMGIPFDRTVENIDRLHAMTERGELGFTLEISRVGDGSDTDDEFVAWVNHRWPAFNARVWTLYDAKLVPDVGRPVAAPDVGCQHWFTLPILASGKVVFCCADSHGLTPIDDLEGKTLLDVYNEPSRRALRAQLPSRLSVDPCFSCERL